MARAKYTPYATAANITSTTLGQVWRIAREDRLFSLLSLVTLLSVIAIGCVDNLSPFSTSQEGWPNPEGNIGVLKDTEQNPVGAIAGTFAVDLNGAATYSIPIKVIPGINGVQPELSLVYNSHGGVGPLGVGWSLSSIPSIQRCPMTKAQDEMNGGIYLNGNDRFCMDGLRLVRVDLAGNPIQISESMPYFVKDAIYATESQTYTKITSYGVCGLGPCSFIAYNKDGTMLEFGARQGEPNNSSTFFAQGRSDNTILAWSLSRTTDLNGNYVQIIYNTEASERESGEYYVQEINYTGNNNTVPAHSPQRKVSFIYSDPDSPNNTFNSITKYVAGSQVKITRRLEEIQTSILEADPDAGTAIVSKYKLMYDRDHYGIYEKIKSVERCVIKGTSDVCLPATKFTYGEGVHRFPPSSPPPGSQSGYKTTTYLKVFPGDVNGDGKADLINAYTSLGVHLCIYLSNSTGFDSHDQGNVDPYNSGQIGLWPMDIDGDGKTDLVQGWDWNGDFKHHVCFIYYMSQGTNEFRKYQPRDNGEDCVATGHNFGADRAWIAMDHDGDGITDLIRIFDEDWGLKVHLYTSNGTRFTHTNTIEQIDDKYEANYYDFFAANVNGDSCADLIFIRKKEGTSLEVVPYISTCKGGFTKGIANNFDDIYAYDYGGNWENSKMSVADVNGDGRDDLVFTTYYKPASNKLYIVPFLSSGGNTYTYDESKRLVYDKDVESYKYLAMDINGDGLSDLVRLSSGTYSDGSNGQLYFSSFISKGDRLEQAQAPLPTGRGWSHHDFIPMDVNGDGIADIVQTWSGANYATNIITYISSLERPFAKVIKDGMDGATNIEYLPLTDKKVYTKGSDAKWPEQDIQSSLQVVSSYHETDGRDLQDGGYLLNFSYHYAGAKADLKRSWLGFKTIASRNLESYITNTREFEQIFPKAGMIKTNSISYQKNTITDPILIQQLNKYIYNNLRDPSDAINEIVLTEEESSIYDQNGAFSYSQTKKYYYDNDKLFSSSTPPVTPTTWYGNLVMVEGEGDETVAPTYQCIKYDNDTDKNQLGYGYITEIKNTSNKTNCIDFVKGSSTWHNDDISWNKIIYDPEKANRNITISKIYDNESDSNNIEEKWNVTSYDHDNFGNLTSVIDGLGAVVTTTYDSFYKTYPIMITAPKPNDDAASASLIYNISFEPYYGNALTVTDPNIIKQTKDFDKLGRKLAIYTTTPEGQDEIVAEFKLAKDPTTSEYYAEARGLTNWGSIPTWSWSKNYFNAKGVSYKINYLGPVDDPEIGTHKTIEQKVIFDSQGRVSEATLPYFVGTDTDKIPSSKAEYDAFNYPTKVINPDGSVICNHYVFPSPTSQPYMLVTTTLRYSTNDCESKYPDDQTTVKKLNSKSNVEESKLPNGGKVKYGYDKAQRLTSMLDPEGVTILYSYDSMNRIKTINSGDMGLTSFVYDIYGRLEQTTDANSQIIKFKYDKLRRLISKEDVRRDEVTVYKYDEHELDNGLGRLTSVQMEFKNSPTNVQHVEYKYGYDQNGLPNHLEVTREDESRPYIFTSTHDPQSRIISATFPDSSVMQYEYTKNGNLERILLGSDAVTYSGFTELGEPTDISFSNGVKTTYQYIPGPGSAIDPYGTVRKITVNGFDQLSERKTLLSLEYGWKDDTVRNIIDGVNPVQSQTFVYQEQMHFLSSATGAYGNQQFGYNKSGSINHKESSRYNYNKVNSHQVTSIDPLSYTKQMQALTLLYELNGNLKSKIKPNQDSINFTYDAMSNLRQVTASKAGASSEVLGTYMYDFTGRRITKIDKDGGKTQYITPFYEVATPPGKSSRYTKYINGLYGRVASITTEIDSR